MNGWRGKRRYSRSDPAADYAAAKRARPFPYDVAEGPLPPAGWRDGGREVAASGWNEREYSDTRRAVESVTGGIYIATATFLGWQWTPAVEVKT